MSAVWTAVSTFLNNILILIAGGTIGEETVQGLVPWIVANGTVAIFVLTQFSNLLDNHSYPSSFGFLYPAFVIRM